MKLTKARLQQIIKEELASLREEYGHEGDADEAFIQSSRLGRADAEADEALDRNSEEDEGYQANRMHADSDKDYVRAYEAERRKGALELPSLGYDAKRQTFASPKQQRIARHRAGDK